MYDWANSAMVVVVMTTIFPIFFSRFVSPGTAEEATQDLAIANSLAMAVVAVLAPILGALSDYSASKKRFLGISMGIGVSAVASMFFIRQGDVGLAATLFVIAIIGATGSFVFYEALLPHIAGKTEMDRVSTAGYAIGYLGGGLLLALNLAWIMRPALFGFPTGEDLTPSQESLPSRVAFLSVAIWWIVFSIPLFRRVSEPPRLLEADERTTGSAIKSAFVRLGETLRELRGYKQAFLMLLAFLIYNDGIQTIIKMAAIYGDSIGIGETDLIAAIMIVQFIGIPFSFLFGMLAGVIGAKRSIFLGLVVYTGISILGYFMTSAAHFYLLALLVGAVQGGTQALSRSLFASMIPRHKSGEFFGFFSVFEKFAGVFGPLIFAATIGISGSARNAILSVILFFAVGAVLLAFVKVDEGQRVAREAEAETAAAA